MDFERTRPTKQVYYLEIAKAVARRSTCVNYQFGAVIVKNDRIVATGYNGSPVECPNCCDRGTCMLADVGIPISMHPDECPAIDAEINAIISASRETILYGSLYVYGWNVAGNCIIKDLDSSNMAKRVIINSGLDEVIYADPAGVGRSDGDGIHYGYRIVKVDDLKRAYDHLIKRLPPSKPGSTKL